MRLLTKQVLAQLPKLYVTEGDIDPMIKVKFFMPGTYCTWYAIEFDGKDVFYGYVIGDESELGYFSLQELQLLRNKFGFGVERDIYFRPTSLNKVKAMIQHHRSISYKV